MTIRVSRGLVAGTLAGLVFLAGATTATAQAPALTLNYTVSASDLNPLTCATEHVISVQPGDQVKFCYEVTNTGGTPFNFHDLFDSGPGAGQLLSNSPFALAPGSSTFTTRLATVGSSQINTATWEARDVLPALLAAMGIDRPVLLGHSDGGSIALLYAADFPVTACAVMAPQVIVEDLSVRSIEEARVAYETGGLRDRLQRYHADVDCAFWQWNDIWLDPAFRAFDIRADCRRIEAPVLAMQGVEDPYGTLRQIEDIAPTLGPLERRVLPQCGHSPHRDQPDASRQAIVDFLAPLP